MKKKGFTLVELLAVIVILAVIALIATPIILNVIEESKKGAAEQSALGYIDALEKQIVINSMDEDASNDIGNGTFDIKDLEVNIKGTKPTSGSVTIVKGKVETTNLIIGDYSVKVDENGKVTSKKESAEEKYTVYANGTEIYFDPINYKICEDDIHICYKWYAFNDDDKSSTINLILSSTMTGVGFDTAWGSTSGSNQSDKLTETLTNLITEEGWHNLSIRAISKEELDEITGQGLNTEGSFDSNFSWLFDNNVDNGACYWTSTFAGSDEAYDIFSIGNGSGIGFIEKNSIFHVDCGIRPVITIPKSIISS